MGKCIKGEVNGNVVIKRVSDGSAAELVRSGKWSYTSKSAWRSFRNNGSTTEEPQQAFGRELTQQDIVSVMKELGNAKK